MLADLLPRIEGKFVLIPIITFFLLYPIYLLLWLALALNGVIPMSDILPLISNEALIVGLIIGFLMSFVLVSLPSYYGKFKKNAIEDISEAIAGDVKEDLSYKLKFNPRYGAFMFLLSFMSAVVIIGGAYIMCAKYPGFNDPVLIGICAFMLAPVVAYIVDKYALHDVADGTKTVKEQFVDVKKQYEAFRATLEAGDKYSIVTKSKDDELAAAIASAVAAAVASIKH